MRKKGDGRMKLPMDYILYLHKEKGLNPRDISHRLFWELGLKVSHLTIWRRLKELGDFHSHRATGNDISKNGKEVDKP
jgi:hypothetical protein